MNRRIGKAVALGCLLSLVCSWAEPVAASNNARQPRLHEFRILAQPKAGVSQHEIQKFHDSRGSRMVRTFNDSQNLQVLQVARGETVDSAVERYRQSGLFEFVEADQRISLAAVTPDDPKFLDGTLWGLLNSGQNGGLAGADISAPAAWAIRHCASNIVVAVIDSGVRYTHEDLAANMWRHPVTDAYGTNAVVGTSDPNDDNGHGTLIAGILGASGNNGIGVVGVAWNVQIMACKFVDRWGDGTLADAVACIDYARVNGANIINASWGIDEFSPALSNAVWRAREAGITVVAAAGNRSYDIDEHPYYPASLRLDNVIAVAATTRTDGLHVLSSYGASSVHLGAPGNEIYSTHHWADDSYATRFGTSMAAAYVSGAMALLRAHFPDEPQTGLTERLLNGVDAVAGLQGRTVSGGRLNLFKALSVSALPPRLAARLSGDSNELELEIFGEPGRHYLIQATSDFENWSPMDTDQVGPAGSFTLAAPLTTHGPARFFRAVEVEPPAPP